MGERVIVQFPAVAKSEGGIPASFDLSVSRVVFQRVGATETLELHASKQALSNLSPRGHCRRTLMYHLKNPRSAYENRTSRQNLGGQNPEADQARVSSWVEMADRVEAVICEKINFLSPRLQVVELAINNFLFFFFCLSESTPYRLSPSFMVSETWNSFSRTAINHAKICKLDRPAIAGRQ